MDIRKVHLVFKTHLDIGFTDFSGNVLDHYVYNFIPAAMKAAQEYNEPGKPKRFVWTAGSFIVGLALRTLPGEAAAQLDDAIRRGDITYHGLPFTMHSELCGLELFNAGLGITKRLDERFNRKTIAAKLSDVPGHTIGIVKPLAESGIEYLHIGINGVACLPQVPRLFLWENPQEQRIIVNYVRSYGGVTALENHDEALYFLHTSDNMGPPSRERLLEVFGELQSQFPDAEIVASTLDAFALSLRRIKDQLPVVRGEIGDTWIHGIGSDPKKTAMLREMNRLSGKWDREGAWDRYQAPGADGRTARAAFLEGLLMVCEHTWGLDMKKYLADFVNWSRADFDRARKENTLSDTYGMGTPYEHVFLAAKKEFEEQKPKNLEWFQRTYALFEQSHQEKRENILSAVSFLPPKLKKQAEDALARLENLAPPAILHDVPRAERCEVSGYKGALVGNGITLTTPRGRLLRIRLPVYQEVGLSTYQYLEQHCLYNVNKNRDWAAADNSKPGIEYSDAPHDDVLHTPHILGSACDHGAWQLEGRFDEAPKITAGCPEGFLMRLSPCSGGIMLTLLLYNKPANRKPEALFLPVMMEDAHALHIKKIGQWIDPRQCVPRGNQRVHGVESFEWLNRDGNILRVSPLHTPLISLGQPKLLEFEGVAAYDRVYMNLHNNLWGTNFKMWYDEDIVCQFLIEELDAQGNP